MEKMKRILVINDEPDMLKQMTRILENEGHKIESTLTGENGLCLLQKHDFDLVFLDYHLKKEKNGATTAKTIIPELRKVNPSIPIIIISATECNLSPKELNVLAVLKVTSACWQQIIIWASMA